MNVRQILQERARAWKVRVDEVSDTETSLVAFGSRGADQVVLKVFKDAGDAISGSVLRVFDGRSAVRVYEHGGGAILLDRIVPASSLACIVLEGRDDEATDVLADVMHGISGAPVLPNCPTVLDWGQAFDRYRRSGDARLPQGLVEEAARRFAVLSASQRRARLLHGDLHHYNVLFDSARGWLAIDPKGVLGETEYELGAALRNPLERPDLFASASVVERRIARFARRLSVDAGRVLEWGFAQAVLAVIWKVEDRRAVHDRDPFLQLAAAIRPMLAPVP